MKCVAQRFGSKILETFSNPALSYAFSRKNGLPCGSCTLGGPGLNHPSSGECQSAIEASVSMPPAANDNRTDHQLVDAVNHGDISAFDVLYYRHRDWVMRLAMRFTGHHEDALDVLQETFAYLVRKFPGFQLSAALTTFLYPAVKNYSIAARRKRLRSSGGGEELSLIVEPEANDSDVREELSQALASLSDSHREILLMRFVDEMTQPEIAAALGLPLGTVKSRLHHATLAARHLPCFAEHRSDGSISPDTH
jgi:RNA polymerase sigma-70 factor, ECF subfamily